MDKCYLIILELKNIINKELYEKKLINFEEFKLMTEKILKEQESYEYNKDKVGIN